MELIDYLKRDVDTISPEFTEDAIHGFGDKYKDTLINVIKNNKVFNENYCDLPLHINSIKKRGVNKAYSLDEAILNWRLKIGK